MRRMQASLAYVALALLLAAGRCSGFEVYLRQLTIYQTHELPLIDNQPEVYLSCDDDGRDKVELPSVRQTNQPYAFEEGHRPVTFVELGQCRQCRLKESDPMGPDDVFGGINVCEPDFRDAGLKKYLVPEQYEIQLQCVDCVAKKLPPPPPTEAPESEKIGSDQKTNGQKNDTAKNATDEQQLNGQLEQSDAWKAVDELQEESEFEMSEHAGVRSWVPIALTVVLAAMFLGLVCGAVSYRVYHRTREQMEEERMAEFEAILGDPGVDFEDIAEEDRKAFEYKLGAFRLWGWRPKMWNRVPEAEKPGQHIPVSKV